MADMKVIVLFRAVNVTMDAMKRTGAHQSIAPTAEIESSAIGVSQNGLCSEVELTAATRTDP